jgi:Arc/MetJ-type ribon-helix-helix transcriptional regulator
LAAVGGKRRGKLPQTKVQVSLPDVLIERIEEHMKKRGSATSVADFVRQSASEKIDRLEREERGISEPVDIAALGDPLKAARRRQ